MTRQRFQATADGLACAALAWASLIALCSLVGCQQATVTKQADWTCSFVERGRLVEVNGKKFVCLLNDDGIAAWKEAR